MAVIRLQDFTTTSLPSNKKKSSALELGEGARKKLMKLIVSCHCSRGKETVDSNAKCLCRRSEESASGDSSDNCIHGDGASMVCPGGDSGCQERRRVVRRKRRDRSGAVAVSRTSTTNVSTNGSVVVKEIASTEGEESGLASDDESSHDEEDSQVDEKCFFFRENFS